MDGSCCCCRQTFLTAVSPLLPPEAVKEATAEGERAKVDGSRLGCLPPYLSPSRRFFSPPRSLPRSASSRHLCGFFQPPGETLKLAGSGFFPPAVTAQFSCRQRVAGCMTKLLNPRWRLVGCSEEVSLRGFSASQFGESADRRKRELCSFGILHIGCVSKKNCSQR